MSDADHAGGTSPNHKYFFSFVCPPTVCLSFKIYVNEISLKKYPHVFQKSP